MAKLNLGGSKDWRENSWVNLDKSLNYDLSKKLLKNYEDNSVSLIFMSHCLEHLSWDIVPKILSECHRVLKASGILRIIVPDTDILHKLLLRNDKQYLIDNNPIYYRKQAKRDRPLIEDIKEQMGYTGEHESFFCWHTLYIFLKIAGFNTVYKSGFLSSEIVEMRKEAVLNKKGMPISGFDNILVEHISLYVECRK
jgi:predicted SAM-dependent methyltransferase